jgi:D-methionine transport system substrate-binding protein
MKKILVLISLLLVLTLSACTSTKEDKVIRVGASPAPHAEILEVIRPLIEAQGYTLEIVEYTDYVFPNTNVEEGELDANYFQHVPYLDYFNENNGTHIVSVLAVHFEPLGLYPGKTATLAEIQDGAKIAIPNDATNEARALALLESLGLITVDPAKTAEATILDITSNPHNIEFIEIVAENLVVTLPDVDFAVINGNYALEGGITSKVLATEDKDSTAAQTYANILAVKEGNEDTKKTQILMDALSSQTVKDFIEDNYYPVVISVLE